MTYDRRWNFFNRIFDSDTKVIADDNTKKIEIQSDGFVVGTFDQSGLSLISGSTISEFSTDGTLLENSDTSVPTEKAVKTYVDDLFSGVSGDIYYYVSPTGSDSTGEGTITSPWKTISHAINQAPRFLNGYGVYIFLADGTYTIGTVNVQGVVGGPIGIFGQNFDPDTVLIEDQSGSPGGFFIQDCEANFLYLSMKTYNNNNPFIISYGHTLNVDTCKFGDNGNTNTVGIQCNFGTTFVYNCGDIDANKISTGVRGAGGIITVDGIPFGDTYVGTSNKGFVNEGPGIYGSTDWFVDINGNKVIRVTPTSAAENSVLFPDNGYLNFNETAGATGYGIRDNTGVLEIKHEGESWNRVRYQKVGSGSLSIDSTSATVLFYSGEPDENYSINSLVLVNTVDDPPSFYSMIVTSKTTLGFTVLFSGPIDSSNYTLEWSIIR